MRTLKAALAASFLCVTSAQANDNLNTNSIPTNNDLQEMIDCFTGEFPDIRAAVDQIPANTIHDYIRAINIIENAEKKCLSDQFSNVADLEYKDINTMFDFVEYSINSDIYQYVEEKFKQVLDNYFQESTPIPAPE